MTGWLVLTTVGVSVALVVVAAQLALRGRDLQLVPLVLVGVVQVLLVVQAVVVVTRLLLGDRPQSTVIVVAYLIGVLLVPAVGALWALGDRSRWGNAVLVVTGLASATMTVRLWDLWHPVT